MTLKIFRHARALILISLIGTGIFGCSADTATSPALRTPDQGYYTLHVNQRAVNLALTPPANTVQLTATPLNAAGVPLVGLGRATYTAADSTVTVDSTGLVTARFITSVGGTTYVVVTLQSVAQNVTHTDTVVIQVTATVPPTALATFSMQPAVGDSAKRAVGSNTFLWPVRATNTAHATVCDTIQCPLLVSYTSSNPSAAIIDPLTGQVTTVDTGHTVLTATTWDYGVAWRDSVTFTIGYQVNYVIALTTTETHGITTLSFGSPQTLMLGVGAEVVFWNQSNQPADVVFDYPEHVEPFLDVAGFSTGAGNIPAFGGDTVGGSFFHLDNFVARGFRTPGTYRYHSTLVLSDTFALIIAKD